MWQHPMVAPASWQLEQVWQGEGRQVSLPLRGPGGPHPFLRTGPQKAAVGELRMVIGTLGGELSGWVGDLVHNHRGLCVQQMWASDGLATVYCVTSAEHHGSSHLLHTAGTAPALWDGLKD